MQTLLLDASTWDLADPTPAGNMAVASDHYSQEQDVSSAAKTFQNEVYYDTTQGVPYWQNILGYLPPTSMIKSKYVLAALTVPGVTAAVVYIASIVNRLVGGQIQFTTSDPTVPPQPVDF